MWCWGCVLSGTVGVCIYWYYITSPPMSLSRPFSSSPLIPSLSDNEVGKGHLHFLIPHILLAYSVPELSRSSSPPALTQLLGFRRMTDSYTYFYSVIHTQKSTLKLQVQHEPPGAQEFWWEMGRTSLMANKTNEQKKKNQNPATPILQRPVWRWSLCHSSSWPSTLYVCTCVWYAGRA